MKLVRVFSASKGTRSWLALDRAMTELIGCARAAGESFSVGALTEEDFDRMVNAVKQARAAAEKCGSKMEPAGSPLAVATGVR